MTKRGAPSLYDPELGARVCSQIAGGKSIRQICNGVEDMPSATTIYNWLYKQKEFIEQYANAREAQSEFYAQDIIDLADSCGLSQEEVAKCKLQIDSRKWIASKLKPKKYGDSTTIKGDKENPLDIGLAALLDVAAVRRTAIAQAPESVPIEGEYKKIPNFI